MLKLPTLFVAPEAGGAEVGALPLPLLTGGSGGSTTSAFSSTGVGGKAGGSAAGSTCVARLPAHAGEIGSTL